MARKVLIAAGAVGAVALASFLWMRRVAAEVGTGTVIVDFDPKISALNPVFWLDGNTLGDASGAPYTRMVLPGSHTVKFGGARISSTQRYIITYEGLTGLPGESLTVTVTVADGETRTVKATYVQGWELQINGQSAMLGEAPTTITYTREWPYGRYTHPEGGRFIREYGRSSPLPEALAEIERAGQPTIAIEPVVVPESAAVPAYTAIGGVTFPYWGVPEMLEEVRAERGPSPPYEREYLAGLGKPTGGFSKSGKHEPVL